MPGLEATPKDGSQRTTRQTDDVLQADIKRQWRRKSTSFADHDLSLSALSASVTLWHKVKSNERSFFIFSSTNAVRKAVAHTVGHRWFGYVTMVLVLANCIFLAANDPKCKNECAATSKWARTEAVADIIFTVAFTTEILLQALAKGFIFGPAAYMHGSWAWVDFICVLSGYTAYIPNQAYNVSGLRAFRALRPLRALAAFPGMQLLVNTLVGSIPLMLNVVILLGWIFLVFGIMGLELFKGVLRGRCVDSTGQIAVGLEDQVCRDHGRSGTFSCPDGTTCLTDSFESPSEGRTSFDNFGWAILNILQLITLSNWTDGQMYYLIDGAGYGAVIYFILLILFGSFFALNLLTAIISAKFAQLQAQEVARRNSGNRAISDALPKVNTWRGRLALRWARFVKALKRPTLRSEMAAWRQAVRRTVAHAWFNHVITLLIVVNTLIMAMYHYGMSVRFAEALERINGALAAGFTLRMLLKHIARTSAFGGGGGGGLSALRTFRLLRVVRSLKLLRQFPSLKRLMKMVVKGFIELKDFMLILVLFLFIFSVLGMQLFGGNAAYDPDVTATYRKNFNSIWQAFYTVFEVLTASNWPSIMHDGMNARGDWAATYFVLWIIIGHMVLLTLFLAILINNFQGEYVDSTAVTPRSVRSFEEDRAWQSSMDATGRSMDGMGQGSLEVGLNQVMPLPPQPTVNLVTSPSLLAAEQDAIARQRLDPQISQFAKMVQSGGGYQDNSTVLAMRKWLLSIGETHGVKHAQELLRQMAQEEGIRAGMAEAGAPGPRAARLWQGLREAGLGLARNLGSAVASVGQNADSLLSGELPMAGQRRSLEPTSSGWQRFADAEDGQDRGLGAHQTPFADDIPIAVEHRVGSTTFLTASLQPSANGEPGGDPHRPFQPSANGDLGSGPDGPDWSHGYPEETLEEAAGKLLHVTSADLDSQCAELSSSMSAELAARWELALWLRRLSVAHSLSEEAEHFSSAGQAVNDAAGPTSLSQEPPVPSQHLVHSLDCSDSTFVVPFDRLDHDLAPNDCEPSSSGDHIVDITAHADSCGESGSETQHLMDSMWHKSKIVDFSPHYSIPGSAATDKDQAAAQRRELGLHKRRSFRIFSSPPHSGLEPDAELLGSGQRSDQGLIPLSLREAFSCSGPVAESGPEEAHVGLLAALDPASSFAGGLGFPRPAAVNGDSGLGFPQLANADAGLPKPALQSGQRRSSSGDGMAVQPGRRTSVNFAEFERQPSLEPEEGAEAKAVQRTTSLTVTKDAAHLQYRALYCLGPRNHIRRLAMFIVKHPVFESVIIALILISSVLLAANSPSTPPDSRLARITDVCDRAFTFIFAAEMVLKVLATGFVMHPGAYLRIPWNQLDFLIVVTSLASVFSSDGQLAIFRALRTTRALRPLRMISRFKGMAIVVEALIRSLPNVASVVMFGVFEFVVFAILGTQLFAGTTWSCNDVEIDGVPVLRREQCVPGYFECTAADNCSHLGAQTARLWQKSFFNFDNVGDAIMCLFIVSTLDDYMENVANKIIDAVGVGMQPQENANPAAGIYVLVFVFLGSFFWVNLMVGVVIDHYSHLINEMGANVMLTEGQKRWMKVLQLKESQRRTFEESWIQKQAAPRRLAARMINSPYFDPVILLAIVLNIIIMAMPYQGQSAEYVRINDNLNAFFTFLFTAEAVVKITAFGPGGYVADRWNLLDILIVSTSLIDMIPGVDVGIGSTVFRIFRVLRMFKVVQQARGLRTLFNTLFASLPAIFNVGSLLFLLMFVYAVLGMSLFGDPHAPLAANPHANFNNFGVAMLTLFRTFTGDGWGAVLQLAAGCTESNFMTCSPSKAAVSALYFSSFMVIGAFVMLNLVIAVILDKFVENASSEGLFRNTDFYEIMSKKMVLDRFMRKLKLKVKELREAELRGVKGKRGKVRRKSMLMIAELMGTGPKLPIY
ncbi:hypothetical protein WJX72_001160 [[Myrmecia] bisecta]|uniref:Ion transport domain-containing protein n=1 Tax=[Myrmecia] bisecta TaxID=41462 RepID=A0AAW1QP58_9CHLO